MRIWRKKNVDVQVCKIAFSFNCVYSVYISYWDERNSRKFINLKEKRR